MRLVRCFIALASLGLAALASAQPLLRPEPLDNFDGKEWAGLELGVDTDASIKKKFKVEKGAVRPEALKFVADKGDTVRVDALLDGRGGKAVMRAIRVEYKGRGPSLMDLTDAWDERSNEYYQRGRTEDWRVEAFENKGVIAIVSGSGSQARVSSYLLMDPDRVPLVTNLLTTEHTRIERPRDPGEDWDRIVRYGYVNVWVDLGSGRPEYMNNRWLDDLKESVQSDARYYRGNTVRGGNGNGTLQVRITSNSFNGESANFKVSLALNTRTPYGDLSRWSDESRTIDRSHRARVTDLLRYALDELDEQVRRVVRGYGPEPVEAARQRMSDAMYAAASGAS